MPTTTQKNYQEYTQKKEQIRSQIEALQHEARELKRAFIASMQAQGWAYVDTEHVRSKWHRARQAYVDTEHEQYEEAFGLSARLLSPAFLEKYKATRETIEGSEVYLKVEYGKERRYQRDRVDIFDIDWDKAEEEDKKEIIFL